MPNVACPNCRREVAFSPEAEHVACIWCGASVDPSSNGVLVDQSPSNFRRRKKRQPQLIAAIAGASFLLIGAIVAVIIIRRASPSISVRSSQSPMSDSATHAIVTDYLKKNLNDQEGIEFIEWGEPHRHLACAGMDGDIKYATSILVKYRAKNAVGAKMIHDEDFLISDGDKTVIGVAERVVGHYFHREIVGAFNENGTIASGVIRGTVTIDGKPFEQAYKVLWLSLSLDVKRESDANDWIGGNMYQFGWVPPGEWSVSGVLKKNNGAPGDTFSIIPTVIKFHPDASGAQKIALNLRTKR